MSKRMLGYLRISRADRSRDTSLGIEAQREAILSTATVKGWEIVGWYVDDGVSGKDTDRPGLQAALAVLRNRKRRTADGLVAAKLDRLSRSVIDFSDLLATSHRQRWAIAVLDFDLDTGNATGRFIAGVLMQVAQFERELIGERTSAALAALKAEGVQLGKPSQVTPEVQAAILLHHAAGLSLSAIARRLNIEGVPTQSGAGQWSHTVVGGVVRRSAEKVAA
ncbi:recombinase family protein [Cryobacterium sp. M25]|uniref:recombinase family protein n=1 Tax=Cryobacterium sp. M25 TaxID=2048293 RepID=UPI000CE4D328|nr:recombinase family protein [Cryobacterium sp. M25]